MVRCWGNNDDGQLGTSVAMGEVSGTPVAVAGAPPATAIATTDATACALANDGSVSCWGDGEDGELGDGVSTTNHSRSTVAPVQGLPSSGAQVAAGESNVCAVIANGDLWCWGANDGAQLGGGSPGPSVGVPQKINVSNVAQVAVADFLGCAVITDGTVQCWGASDLAASGVGVQDGGSTNDGGPSYQPPMRVVGIPLASQVVIGGQHTCVLGRDGTVWCWGANTAGQIGPNAPVGNDPPTQIPL
jgi:alpha-tubulin suppressor-like RCC1 family protein